MNPSNIQKNDQPWIHSARVDLSFILAPAFFSTALAAYLYYSGVENIIQPWSWLLLIVAIDVAHVYSSLYRTYFDPDELKQRSFLYTTVPLLALVGGVLLYSASELVFWRVLAYLAVFHFIRQQYGFMRIYARGQSHSRIFWERYERPIDAAAIYLATLYPLVYWHTHRRHFQWFVEGDFFEIPSRILSTIVGGLYVLSLVLYFTKEIYLFKRHGFLNAPKNLLLGGTALSWYFGIVYFNGDLTFTLTNVVSHGVPYFALIWVYGRRRWQKQEREKGFSEASRGFSIKKITKIVFRPRYLFLFWMIPFAFAFLEESLWDSWLWHEHASIFGGFSHFIQWDTRRALPWLVPLLATPQATHYLLDAFIWRLRDEKSDWKQLVFQNAN